MTKYSQDYEQIAKHVLRHNITNWLDVNNEGWPESQVHPLFIPDWLVLGDPVAQLRLVTALQSLPSSVLASE